MQLTEYQTIYLQTVYDYFRENGEWPTYRQVERKLLPTYRDFDVFEIAKSLIDSFSRSFFTSDPKRQASLSIEHIHQCQGSEQDLANFVEVIRYSADKYINSNEDQVPVSSDEVSSNLHMEDLAVRKVGLMIANSPVFTVMQSHPIGTTPEWALTLSKDVTSFDKVKSIDDYLERYHSLHKLYDKMNANLLESSLVDPSSTIEKIAQADPSNIQEIAASQLQIGNSYYINMLRQSQQSFVWALIGGGIGIVFFIVAIFLFVFRQPTNLSYLGPLITALGGAVVEVIAGIMLSLYGRASNQAASYHVRLDRIQRFLVANSACESLEGDIKHTTRAEIIKNLG